MQINEYGCFLKKKGNRIIITKNRQKYKEICLENIEMLIIGRGTLLTSDLLTELCEKGITVFFDFNSRNFITNSSYLSLPEIRLAQFSMKDDEKVVLAKEIIRAKIHNQVKVCEAYEREMDIEHNEINKAKNIVEIRSIESKKAREYWKNIRSLLINYSFNGRIPRSGEMINTCLDYTYGILRNCVFRGVLNASLDPYIGVIHSTRDYKASFVFDIMEIFRPVFDFYLIDLLLKKDWESFEEIKYYLIKQIDKALGIKYKFKGKKHPLLRLITMQCYEVSNYIRFKDKVHTFKVMEWQK